MYNVEVKVSPIVRRVLVEVSASGIKTNGLSAYEIAVINGFVGTEEEWLESLQGGLPTGGTTGQVPIKQSATDYDVAYGFIGTSNLAPAFKSIVNLGNISGNVNLDFDLAVKYIANLTGDTTLTFSNVTNYVGLKTQQLELTSNSNVYVLSYPLGVDAENDLSDVDLLATNYITFFPHTDTIFQSSVKVV